MPWTCLPILDNSIIKIPAPLPISPSGDTFLLTWQVGANVRIGKDMSFKVAPMLYTYSGTGTASSGLNQTFVGQGNPTGTNPGVPGGTYGA